MRTIRQRELEQETHTEGPTSFNHTNTTQTRKATFGEKLHYVDYNVRMELFCCVAVCQWRCTCSSEAVPESSADRRGEGDGWAVGGDVAVHATRSRVGAGNVSAVQRATVTVLFEDDGSPLTGRRLGGKRERGTASQQQTADYSSVGTVGTTRSYVISSKATKTLF